MNGKDRIVNLKNFEAIFTDVQAMAVIVLSGTIHLILPFVAKHWSFEEGCKLIKNVVKGMKLADKYVGRRDSNYLMDEYVARICGHFAFEGNLLFMKPQDIISIRLLIKLIDEMVRLHVFIRLDFGNTGWLVKMLYYFVFATDLVLTTKQQIKLIKRRCNTLLCKKVNANMPEYYMFLIESVVSFLSLCLVSVNEFGMIETVEGGLLWQDNWVNYIGDNSVLDVELCDTFYENIKHLLITYLDISESGCLDKFYSNML